jgi:hypothetical protein
MESKTNNLYLGVSEHGGIIWYNPNHAYENYDKHRENRPQKCSNKRPLFLLHDIYRASCRSWIAITSPSAWEDVILSEALVNLGGAANHTWPVIKHSNWKNGSTTYTVYVRMYVYIYAYYMGSNGKLNSVFFLLRDNNLLNQRNLSHCDVVGLAKGRRLVRNEGILKGTSL